MDGQSDRLLTPGEVAALFRVDPKTVTRWAASGRISSIRTPGGHRRYREVEIRALLGMDADHSGTNTDSADCCRPSPPPPGRAALPGGPAPPSRRLDHPV